jgi:hypothetical protein
MLDQPVDSGGGEREAWLRTLGAVLGIVAVLGGALAALLSTALAVIGPQESYQDWNSSAVGGLVCLAWLGLLPAALILRGTRRGRLGEVGFFALLTLAIYGVWAALLLNAF